jgi:hypothetical protein
VRTGATVNPTCIKVFRAFMWGSSFVLRTESDTLRRPVERAAGQNLAGIGWKAGAVVVEVEPPLIPICVIGRHVAYWVRVAPLVP